MALARDADSDADQALAEQHAIGGAPSLERGNIGIGGVRAVEGPKDRIGPARGLESRLKIGRRDRPTDARLVAAHAGTIVGPKALEEGP